MLVIRPIYFMIARKAAHFQCICQNKGKKSVQFQMCFFFVSCIFLLGAYIKDLKIR